MGEDFQGVSPSPASRGGQLLSLLGGDSRNRPNGIGSWEVLLFPSDINCQSLWFSLMNQSWLYISKKNKLRHLFQILLNSIIRGWRLVLLLHRKLFYYILNSLSHKCDFEIEEFLKSRLQFEVMLTIMYYQQNDTWITFAVLHYTCSFGYLKMIKIHFCSKCLDVI